MIKCNIKKYIKYLIPIKSPYQKKKIHSKTLVKNEVKKGRVSEKSLEGF